MQSPEAPKPPIEQPTGRTGKKKRAGGTGSCCRTHGRDGAGDALRSEKVEGTCTVAPHDCRVSTNKRRITIVGWRTGGGGGRGGREEGAPRSQVWDAGTRSVVSGGADVSGLEAPVI